MGLAYLQIFQDKQELLSPFTREEKGELLEAMMAYAFHGQEIELETNARYIWPVFRQMIDQSCKAFETKSNARKGKSNQTESNRIKTDQSESESNQSESNEIKPNQAESNGPIKQESRNKNQESGTKKQPRARARDGRFEVFWANYPRKAGKEAARKAFEHIAPSGDLFSRMLEAISQQRASPQWTRDGGQYIPYPATWLNQGRWDDEPTAATTERAQPIKRVNAQQYTQRQYTSEQLDGLFEVLS